MRVPLLAALAALTSLACAAGKAQSPEPTLDRVCSATEVDRFRLMDTAAQYYIEPRFLVESDGRMLLAGQPSYRASADTVSPQFLSRHDVFGALLESGREMHLVPEPFPGKKVKPAAAVALAGGGWGFILLEFDQNADTLEWTESANTPGAVQRIWYSEYRSSRWTVPEQLPIGEATRFNELNGSPLVVSGDTVVWVVPVRSRNSSAYAAVFERAGGVWTQHALERAPVLPITYAVLAHTQSHGFVAGLVRADTIPPFNQNSLFIYVRDSAWRRVRGLIPGGFEPVYRPRMAHINGDSVALSWLAFSYRQEPRALIGDVVGGSSVHYRLAGASLDEPLPVTTRGTAFWLVDADGETRTIRLVQPRGAAVHTIWESPNPYTGFFGAAATERGEILISGPHFEPGRVLVTKVIRLRLECETP